MGNSALIQARKDKNDEFYTQLSDIENELSKYTDENGDSFFRNKVVYCNCDDCYVSNFFRYFALNFNKLGLKKLIATCYSPAPPAYVRFSFFDEVPEIPEWDRPKKIEIDSMQDFNGDGVIDNADVEYLLHNTDAVTTLEGDGDFRSDECVAILDRSDVVVTNPPFSLFRDFIDLMISHNKDFAVIGNMNAVSYKNVFDYIKDKKVRTGYHFNKQMTFRMPDDYEGNETDENGNKVGTVPAIAWFTSFKLNCLEIKTDYPAKWNGNEDKYPFYDNYYAIEVAKSSDIPLDFPGVMGVPITFVDRYDEDKFELLELLDPVLNGESIYKRIAIRNKNFPMPTDWHKSFVRTIDNPFLL